MLLCLPQSLLHRLVRFWPGRWHVRRAVERGFTGLLAMSLLGIVPALGEEAEGEHGVPPPSGEVLLRITGNLTHANVGDERHLDRAQLQALPSRTIETRIPWANDRFRFEGPLLHSVLEAAGVQAASIRVSALNGYEAELPVAELRRYGVILALRRDGEPIAVRDFGPLMVLYPFDEYPELLNERIRFRSVWHVVRIHAL